jgi:hypothetical protein
LSIVLKPGGILERIFGGVKRQIRFVILFGGFNCAEAHSHIFLAGTEKTAYAHHCRVNLTALVDQKILNRSDLLLLGVVNILLIPVSELSSDRCQRISTRWFPAALVDRQPLRVGGCSSHSPSLCCAIAFVALLLKPANNNRDIAAGTSAPVYDYAPGYTTTTVIT